ncbi:hypothetical protein [Peijinzhouia sedimentorum]
MKLTRKTLIELNNALQYLRNSKTKAWYVAGKIARAIKQEIEEYYESLKDIQDNHGLKNEKGELILTKSNGRDMITPIDVKVYNEALQMLNAEEVEFSLPLLPLSQIVDESHPDAIMEVLFDLNLIDEAS